MSKKSFAVGTGAMALRLLLADILRASKFDETTRIVSTERKTKRNKRMY
jgi:hypothetical protein